MTAAWQRSAVSTVSTVSTVSRRGAWLLIVALAFVAGIDRVARADDEKPSSPATQNAPVVPIPIEQIPERAAVVHGELQRLLLKPDPATIEAIDRELAAYGGQIQERLEKTREDLASARSVSTLAEIDTQLKAWLQPFGAWASSLDTSIVQLSQAIQRAEAQAEIWDATLDAARAAAASKETLQRVSATRREIAEARKQLLARRNEVLALQQRLIDSKGATDRLADEVRAAMLDRYADVFRLDALPLWQPELWDTLAAETSLGWSEPILERFREASDYAFARRQVIAFQILLVLLFAVGLRIVSAHVRARTGDEPDVEHASRVFELPISMALVVVLSATRLLHPLAPSMFLQLLWLIAVVPTVLIVRRFGAGAAVRPPLIALTLFTVVDVARAAIETLPTLGRLLLVGELFCAIVVVLVSRRRRRASVREGGPDAVHHFVDVSERAGVLLLCLAIGANLLGAAELGRIVGQGTLRCAYLGLFAYAFYRVLWSVSVFALRLRPLRLLRLVSRDREGVQRRIDPLLRFAAGCLWLLAGVRVFDLSSLAYDELASILGKELRIGALEISLGGVLGFFLTVWLSFRLSRFVSAVLEVEVFPHVRLARGVPYALSALVRYAVLFTGFMVALAVGGVELTKLTVIAGGLGVGIGFGLQNVVNNFVSGLILLFERPLQVGDSVQLPDQKIGGSILRIGTRASIIRTGDGAEVIVPNGALISSAVINWTLSDRHRRVDIDVSVERAAEAQAVIDLLEGQARSHPKVLSTPAARAYLTKLRDDALDLQLRVWIDDLDDELAVRSELGVEIQRALRAAGIGIPPGKLPLSVAQAMLRLSGGSPAHRLDLEDHVDDPGRADRQALRSVDQRKATRLRSKDLDEQV